MKVLPDAAAGQLAPTSRADYSRDNAGLARAITEMLYINHHGVSELTDRSHYRKRMSLLITVQANEVVLCRVSYDYI